VGPFGASDRERAARALEVVGCADLTSRSFSELSGGQSQRVLIARALVSEPDILILDEPTANLDPSVQDDFYDLLHELKNQMTVIIVSHDVAFVSKHVDRVVCVNRKVVLHKASALHGDVIETLYGEMGVHLVDHAHHPDE
jgi:zinc transport system ATP-binding protein